MFSDKMKESMISSYTKNDTDTSATPSVAAAAGTTKTAASVVSYAADTRNMEWRKSNVGSMLLSKMGWSNGEAVGKRQRSAKQSNVTSTEMLPDNGTTATVPLVNTTCNGEGLRVMKRQDGLGIGATAASSAYTNASNAVQHVQDYVNVLALLQPKNKSTKDDKREKKKKRKRSSAANEEGEESSQIDKSVTTAASTLTTTATETTHLSKTRMTNAAVRKAKFQTKSVDDFKGIFGSAFSNEIVSTVIVPSFAIPANVSDETKKTEKTKKKKSKSKDGKKKKETL
jgi:G-patch domain